MVDSWRITCLASQRTEAVRFKEAASTPLADAGHTFGRPRLRPLVKKHHPRTVNDVRLHTSDVQHLLNLWYTKNIVIGWAPYLRPIWARSGFGLKNLNLWSSSPTVTQGILNRGDWGRWRPTCTTWWSLWLGRHKEHMLSPMHCKQNKLHSPLCELSPWIRHDAKKLVFRRGFNHPGPISFVRPLLLIQSSPRTGVVYTNSSFRSMY